MVDETEVPLEGGDEKKEEKTAPPKPRAPF